MDIPTRVCILGIPYEVSFEPMEDGEEGCISPRAQRITLRRGMTREKTEQVYLHELVHGILDQLGFSELYEDEQLVQGLAVGLYMALLAD